MKVTVKAVVNKKREKLYFLLTILTLCNSSNSAPSTPVEESAGCATPATPCFSPGLPLHCVFVSVKQSTPPALILSHLECPSGDRCGGGETPHRHKLLKDRMTVILLMLTPKAMDINIVALASQSGGCFLLCFFV